MAVSLPSQVLSQVKFKHDASTNYVYDLDARYLVGPQDTSLVFKGTVGTGGTVTTLPTASSSNKGWCYYVVTAGTYASIAAVVGDALCSTGTAWTKAIQSEYTIENILSNIGATFEVIVSDSAANTPNATTIKIGGTVYQGALTPTSGHHNAFYLVPVDEGAGIYAEWATIYEDDAWEWENIGTSAVDLSDYARHQNATSTSAGQNHTHDVVGTGGTGTPSFNDNAYAPTLKSISAGLKTNMTIAGTGTASGKKGFEISTDDSAIDSSAAFTTNVQDVTVKIGCEYPSGTGYTVSKTAENFLTAATGYNETIKYGSLDTTEYSFVGGTDTVMGNITQQGSVSSGSAAAWEAEVIDNVLTFDFTANTPTVVTLPTLTPTQEVATKAGTATTVATGTVTESTTDKDVVIELGTPTVGGGGIDKAIVSGSITAHDNPSIYGDLQEGDVSISGGIVGAGTFINKAVAGIDVATEIGATESVDVLTGVAVTQPEFTLALGTTGDASVLTAIERSDDATSITGAETGTASTGHTHGFEF